MKISLVPQKFTILILPRVTLLWVCAVFNASATEQILRKGNGPEPQSLNPHQSLGVPASNILRDLFEGLISEAPNGELIPGVAKHWEIDERGTRYIFYLREQAKWSNGEPVTAHDFVYSWQRIVTPQTGSVYAQILAPILHANAIIQGKKEPTALAVKALDDHTLEVKLQGPTPYFLGLLTHSTTYPLHAATVKKYGNKFARANRLMSNGAYRLTEWVVQSHIILKRNPQYWDNSHTRIDTVYYYPIEDQSTELKRYRAGEIDFTHEIPLNQYKWIKKNLANDLHVAPYLGTYYYGFNLTKTPFKDNIKLRQALTMAIDRKIIAEKITGSGEIPAYGWVPPGISNYQAQSFAWRDMNKADRLAKAQKLYQQAGYSKANPLVIEVRYNTSENHKKIALAISSMWKKTLGVKVKLLNEEWKVFLANRKQKNTEAFRSGWIADYNDAFSFAELLYSQHGINDTGYNNAHYDALLKQSAIEQDQEKRRQLLAQAEQIMLADYPIMPIYFYVTKRLVKPYVRGYQANIMDHHYTKNMYLAK